MSGSASAEPMVDDDRDDYDELLEAVDAAIEQARYKVDGPGRIRDPEKERVRISWCKALAYCANVRRQCTNDAKLEELTERVEELEDMEAYP